MNRFIRNTYQTPLATGVIVFLALTLLGLVNLTHADYYSGRDFHQTQLVYTLLGFCVAVVLMLLDLTALRRFAVVFYWIGILMLIAVLFTDPVNQSRRWLKIFGLTVQPSEAMKLIVAITLADHFRNRRTGEIRSLFELMKPLGIVLLPVCLILLEPDLGTAIVVFGVGFAVILFEGIRLRTFLALVGIFLLLFPVAWKFNIIRPYQKDRIMLWIAPEHFEWTRSKRARLEKTLQPERARWAIGSGQLAGKGAKQGSRIRLRYLPEMHTDFIVATLAEEYGFMGCIFLLLLYLGYISWGLRVSERASDRFGALLSLGVITALALQVVINLGMVTGMLPVVGVTLPLFSKGGSSLIVTMAGFGLLLNVARSKGTL